MKIALCSFAMLVVGGVVAACAVPSEEEHVAKETTETTESALTQYGGTCATSYQSVCTGKPYYSSPNGGVSYCDPTFNGPGDPYPCALVPKGNCSYYSPSNCGGAPQGTICNSQRGHCRAVPGYTDPTPPCGCY